MKQLSGLDAGFLSLETPTAPMTIGSVAILDPGTSDARLDVDGFRRFLRARLHRAPALRRRLAALPLDLVRPYWIELDADQIDLEHHVEKTTLPEPGGWRELAALVAWEKSRPLERDRPLWQLVFVEGLDSVEGIPSGSVAVVSRVHHAAVDGVSGAEILSAVAGSDSPDADGGDTVRSEGGLGGEPGVLDLLGQTGRDLASMPAEISRTVGRSLLGLAGGIRHRAGGPGGSRVSASEATLESPPLPFQAPRTVLNRSITAGRSWAPAFLELERIKAIKNREDATVNDVVLAICASALRGWLADRESLPEQPLVAMVPVSVRAPAEMQSAGNLVSAMLVSLATDERDPVKRLRRIRGAARSSKVAHQAIGARTLVESAQLVPFALSGLGARLYTRMHLAERLRPLFNLVITNVPGPSRPLEIAGARMLAYAPTAPLFDGLGLILPVFSYAGTVSIGVTADRALMSDAQAFASRLEAALDELE